MLSFVYDVADLYKTEVSVPVAFHAAAEGPAQLETRVRRACRDSFHSARLLERIVPDIVRALGLECLAPGPEEQVLDSDMAVPGGLWDPMHGQVAGGVNRGEEPQRKEPDRQEAGPDEDVASEGEP